jgi:hypothetical protein
LHYYSRFAKEQGVNRRKAFRRAGDKEIKSRLISLNFCYRILLVALILSLLLHGYETYFGMFGEEHRMSVFESMIIMRTFLSKKGEELEEGG